MRPVVTDAAPAKSNRRCAVSTRLSRRKTGASAITIAATGTLTKKIQDQLRYDVRMPPRRTPDAAPLPEAAPQIPSAVFRLGPSGNMVIRIDRVAGASNAPPSPCSARNVISEASDQARPHRSELTAK